MQWLTKDDVELIEAFGFTDAGIIEDDALAAYLDVAKEACIAYAPARPADAAIPESWRMAQAVQARNLYQAGAASASEAGEGGTYGITPRPLDWQVKQLLRPRRGLGVIR